MPPTVPFLCPACGKPQGSNASCLSCRDAAARELAREARDVTEGSLPGTAADALRFTGRPPWYARFAAGRLMTRVRLLAMILGDYVHGRLEVGGDGDGVSAVAGDARPVEAGHDASRAGRHCRGGIGRTGTIAAKLLVEFGYEPAAAITLVRRTRPGTIETKTQEQYVLQLK